MRTSFPSQNRRFRPSLSLEALEDRRLLSGSSLLGGLLGNHLLTPVLSATQFVQPLTTAVAAPATSLVSTLVEQAPLPSTTASPTESTAAPVAPLLGPLTNVLSSVVDTAAHLVQNATVVEQLVPILSDLALPVLPISLDVGLDLNLGLGGIGLDLGLNLQVGGPQGLLGVDVQAALALGDQTALQVDVGAEVGGTTPLGLDVGVVVDVPPVAPLTVEVVADVGTAPLVEVVANVEASLPVLPPVDLPIQAPILPLVVTGSTELPPLPMVDVSVNVSPTPPAPDAGADTTAVTPPPIQTSETTPPVQAPETPPPVQTTEVPPVQETVTVTPPAPPPTAPQQTHVVTRTQENDQSAAQPPNVYQGPTVGDAPAQSTPTTANRLPEGFVYWMPAAETTTQPVQVASALPPHAESALLEQAAPDQAEHTLGERHVAQMPERAVATVARRVAALHFVAVEQEETATQYATPQAQGLADAGAVDQSALDQAFTDFLNSLTDLERTLTGWLAQLGPLPWILMGLALVGTACGAMRRLPARRGPCVALDGTELQWALGIGQ